MPTFFYFHDQAPPDSPGETTNSVVLPAHTDESDLGIPARMMDFTAGSSQVSVGGDTIATTNAQDNFFTSFSTPALKAFTFSSGITWTIGVEVKTGNNSANSRIVLSIYVYRPSTSSVVGFLHDSDTFIGSDWIGNQTVGVVDTFVQSGGEVVGVSGDILVCEFWRHTNGQVMPMVYAMELDYDGATDPLQAVNSNDSASYVRTGQGGAPPEFAEPDASHEYITQIKRTVRSGIITR